MNPKADADSKGPLKTDSAEDLNHASSERFSPQSTNAPTSGLIIAIAVGVVALAVIGLWVMMTPG